MTTDELDELDHNTPIYIPTDWEVLKMLLAGRVSDRNFYTLLHPPDIDGTVNNRRPIYIDAPSLLNATLDEQTAWLAVAEGLSERIKWIYRFKLNEQ